MSMIIQRLNDGSETWNADGTACTSAEINYLVHNPTSKKAAIKAVLTGLDEQGNSLHLEEQIIAPATYGELPKKSVRFNAYEGDGCISLSVVYAEADKNDNDYDENDPAEVSFDCGAGTKHITTPIAQECVYAAEGETAESNAEAATIPIGWNNVKGEGSEAAGVDVPIGECRQTYTKTLPKTMVTSDNWQHNIALAVGKVNSAKFGAWQPGEAMFMGASYTTPVKGAKKVRVSFHFNIRPNETNVSIGGASLGNKTIEGFEYIWALTSDKVENGKRVKTMKKIYKAQVCEYANFSGLGV